MTNPHTPTKAGEAASELLPCPFCEGRAITDCESDADYPSKKFMFVRCTRCGTKTSSIYGSGDPSEWADARYNWNRRAPSPADRAASVGAVPLQGLAAWLRCMARQAIDQDTLRTWADEVDAALATPQALPIPQADRSDTERLDWLRDNLFSHKWNGVIGSGYRVDWNIVPHYRHIRIYDESGKAAGDFREAIDTAMRTTAAATSEGAK